MNRLIFSYFPSTFENYIAVIYRYFIFSSASFLSYIVVLICLSITKPNLYGQTAATKLYTIKDGLKYSESITLLLDSKGFLWIGSNADYVTRFDGAKFFSLGQKKGIPFRSGVNEIIEDREGGIWFRYFMQGLLRLYENKIDTFIFFDDEDFPPGVLQHSAADTSLWLFSLDGQNFQWDEVQRSFTLIDVESAGSDVYSTYFFPEGSKRLVINNEPNSISQKGYIVDGEARYLIPNPHSPDPRWGVNRFLGRDTILSCLVGHPSKFFDGEKWEHIPKDLDQIIQRNLTSLILDTDSYPYLILASSKSEHVIVEFNAQLQIERETKFKFKGRIYDLVRDATGNYWATTTKGLLKIFSSVQTFYDDEIPEMIPDLHSIGEDAEGNIWFGSYSNGFCWYDGKKVRPSPTFLKPYKKVLPGSYRSPTGQLFFTIESYPGRGILAFDTEQNLEHLLPGISGYYFTENHEGALVYGSTKQGMFIRDSTHSSWEVIDSQKGLELVNVLTIVQDKYQRYWMGRHSQGIAVYLPSKDTVMNYLIKDPDADYGALSSARDFKGNLWFGTNRGLAFLETPESIDSNFQLQASLRPVGESVLGDDIITSLKVYQDSFLIVGTVTGFGLLDLNTFYRNRESVRIFFLGEQNGNAGGMSEQNAILVDSGMDIWVGNDRGALRLTPTKILADTILPTINLDYVVASNDTIKVNADQKIWLKPNHEDIEVHFTVKRTVASGHEIAAFYQLNGEGAIGISESPLRLNDLRDGRYLIDVFALKHGLATPPLSIEVIIPQPIYQRPLFYLLLLIAGSILTFLVIRWQARRKLQRDQLRIQAIVNQLNPHFINNALQWIQNRVDDSKDMEAVSIVGKLAQNIKIIFENTRYKKSFHSLAAEMQLVKNYFLIQKARFKDQFQYKLPEESLIESFGEKLFVPLMILQIHCENAIEHGIKQQDSGGEVRLLMKDKGNHVLFVIEDEGIGRRRAKEIGSKGTQRGTKMLEELIQIFNSKNPLKIRQYYEDDIFVNAEGERFGTRVIIEIPKDYNYELAQD